MQLDGYIFAYLVIALGAIAPVVTGQSGDFADFGTSAEKPGGGGRGGGSRGSSGRGSTGGSNNAPKGGSVAQGQTPKAPGPVAVGVPVGPGVNTGPAGR